MKNIIIAALLAAAVAFGALFMWQRNQAKTQSVQLAQAQTQLATAESQAMESSEAREKISLAETKARILQSTLKETAASAVEQSNQVAQLKAAAKTNTSPLAAMFKDPKMMELIKAQQKLVMGPMIEKNYSALFKELKLSPEQSASLKELLQSKMLAGADMGMAMLDGSLDAEKRKELGQKVKDDTAAYDQQIKDLLGADNGKAFDAYEKTVPDRMAISQFHDQLAISPNALGAEQEQQLIQVMNEERTSFKWTTDYNNNNPADLDFGKMFTEERLAKFAQEKVQLDQQVLARAKQFLTPEQLTAYEQYQTQQREMQVAAMNMAAKMFGQQ